MYFDISPKTRREDLFGMDYQLELLKGYLSDDNTRMIIVKGLRRTGKTSLLNVSLNETKRKHVKIDIRETPFYDKKEFTLFIIRKIKEELGSVLDKIIKNIIGVRVGYEKFSFELFFSKEENVNLFFERLNKQLEKEKRSLILAFDEAQLLKRIDFDYYLASIFDNYKSIKIVLTGSEIGVLDKLIGKDNYNSPLFGRAYIEIKLEKIREGDTTKFLEEGFKQINKKIEFEEIREVIENLDGIIGWVTYYGWFRYKGFSHRLSLERVREEGKIIIKKELENFLEGRKARIRYLKILKSLTKGSNSWNLLKQKFRKEGLNISDVQLNLYLKELINFGFVEKVGDKYFISDPLLNSIK